MSDPTIEEAKELARQHEKEIVIIFHLDARGRFGYASYGKNRRLCDFAKKIADRAYDAIIGKAGVNE